MIAKHVLTSVAQPFFLREWQSMTLAYVSNPGDSDAFWAQLTPSTSASSVSGHAKLRQGSWPWRGITHTRAHAHARAHTHTHTHTHNVGEREQARQRMAVSLRDPTRFSQYPCGVTTIMNTIFCRYGGKVWDIGRYLPFLHSCWEAMIAHIQICVPSELSAHHLFILPSIYISIHLSMYPSVYLSIHQCSHLSIQHLTTFTKTMSALMRPWFRVPSLSLISSIFFPSLFGWKSPRFSL